MIIIDSYKYRKYLLDLFPATVAYSLRKLKTGQTRAIRVRRSSDNAEQDIGFVGNDLDTTSLLSFCGVGNGFVTTWYDQSNNGYNATQTTQANQPQIVSSGVVITDNGKPAIQFDGNNDVLKTGSLSFNNNNLSVLAVTKPTSSTQKDYANILDMAHDVNGGWTIQQVGSVHNNFYFAPKFVQGYPLGVSTSIPFNTLSLIAYYMSAGSGQFLTYYRNGTQTANLSTSGLTGTSGNSFLSIANWATSPADRQYNGRIQEVIIYNTNQTANRTAIESDINTHYAIY